MDTIDHAVSNDSTSTNSVYSRLYRGRIIIFTLVGVFCYSLHNVLFGYIGDSVPTLETVCLNRTLILLFLVPTLTYMGKSPRVDTKKKLLLLLVSSSALTVGISLFFYGLTHMRAGDVTAIQRTSPVFIGIFGRVFFKETFDLTDLALVVINLIGVALIAQPSFIFGGYEDEDLASALAPLVVLLASVTYAAAYTTTRRLGMLGVDSFVIVLYGALVGSLSLAVMNTLLEGGWMIPPCGSTRYVVVAMGCSLFCGQCFVIYSYANGNGFVVSILSTNEIIFAYLLDFAIFRENSDLTALLGAAMIILVSVVVSVKRTDWFKSLRMCDGSSRSTENHQTNDMEMRTE